MFYMIVLVRFLEEIIITLNFTLDDNSSNLQIMNNILFVIMNIPL